MHDESDDTSNVKSPIDLPDADIHKLRSAVRMLIHHILDRTSMKPESEELVIEEKTQTTEHQV